MLGGPCCAFSQGHRSQSVFFFFFFSSSDDNNINAKHALKLPPLSNNNVAIPKKLIDII
jgi:hypothetical protein